jgi:hypothetical protein
MKKNEHWYCKLCNGYFQGNRIRHLKGVHNTNSNRHSSRFREIVEVIFCSAKQLGTN